LRAFCGGGLAHKSENSDVAQNKKIVYNSPYRNQTLINKTYAVPVALTNLACGSAVVQRGILYVCRISFVSNHDKSGARCL
jgi:hypothetical protein